MAKSIRDAYGESLLKYGKEIKTSCSRRRCFLFHQIGLFGAACPDRFFNVGFLSRIDGDGGGVSTTGKIPFVNTFTAFLCNLGAMPPKGFCPMAT
jgi:transketolase C-terminal domain/subunit